MLIKNRRLYREEWGKKKLNITMGEMSLEYRVLAAMAVGPYNQANLHLKESVYFNPLYPT